MTVVRYTFDVCLREGLGKDIYTMGSLIEKSILGTAGVCGCERSHDADGYSSVKVDAAIRWQRDNGRWLDEEGVAK
ncbi:MAG: hypothetical protein IIY62_00125 [Kiritimatiellae bacterium]|nr:hypothetical protein [Kiritimatiellia bacterium]